MLWHQKSTTFDMQFDAENTKVYYSCHQDSEVCGGHLYPGSCAEYTGHLILAAKGYCAGLIAQYHV
jgi:hypothetical protein